MFASLNININKVSLKIFGCESVKERERERKSQESSSLSHHRKRVHHITLVIVAFNLMIYKLSRK